MELSGQSGSNSAAQVTDEAVEECEDLSRIFSPTSAPLIHQPENGQRGLNAIEAFAMNCWNKCWQQKTKEKKKYSQKAGEQQEQRGQRAETDGDAKFVCVTGETGGDGIRAKFNQTGEKSVGVSSCRCATPHISRQFVCISCYWRK